MPQRRIPLRLIRFKNFLTTLFGNRMAFAGLILLSLFIFMAAGAPYLTPYSPQGTVVSAPLNSPVWTPYLTGDPGWSQNIEFSGLTIRTEGVTLVTSNQGEDSVDLQVSSQGAGGKITLTKTLSYPFQGPAKRFNGDARITASGLSPTNAVSLTVYVDRIGEKRYTFWPTRTLNVSREYTPNPPFDSINREFSKLFDFETLSFNAATVIFSKIADYTYVLELAVPAAPFQASFSIQDFGLDLFGNSWGLLGTDSGGHDIFTQLAHGARLSLLIGLVATFVGVGVGLVVGLIAGYLGKAVDEVLMRFTDMLLVIPGLPLLIVLVAVLGASLLNIILVLGFLGWMGFARVVRSQVLSLKERPFIEAAKASGAGTGYITVRHIFPNIVSLTYVNLALSVPAAIVGEAALSFLGLGDPTVTTWGRMLELSRAAAGANLAWWWVIPPGISIALLSLSFILVGFALDEMFNPKLRKRR